MSITYISSLVSCCERLSWLWSYGSWIYCAINAYHH